MRPEYVTEEFELNPVLLIESAQQIAVDVEYGQQPACMVEDRHDNL